MILYRTESILSSYHFSIILIKDIFRKPPVYISAIQYSVIVYTSNRNPYRRLVASTHTHVYIPYTIYSGVMLSSSQFNYRCIYSIARLGKVDSLFIGKVEGLPDRLLRS